jgi:hypothetical protein
MLCKPHFDNIRLTTHEQVCKALKAGLQKNSELRATQLGLGRFDGRFRTMLRSGMNEGKLPRRSVHRTQWAAQFAVASELCKLGYEVAFTMGNHPSVDIMATSPAGVQFGIDVKGLYKKNFWAVRTKPVKAGLYYVFAFVPDVGANRFFVLTQADVNAEIEAENDRARQRGARRGDPNPRGLNFPGIGWKLAEKFENAWSTLPQ